MAYRNLREYLDFLQKRELLCVVEDRISKDTELVPLVRLQFRGLSEADRKAFWFKNVTDHSYLIICNITNCKIGNKCLIQSGAVIGSEGFGFAYKNNKIGQGRENAKIFLEKNPKIAAEIEMAIRTKAGLISKKIEGNPATEETDTSKKN